MNDEPLDEYGCIGCIHDDEEDHTESCYKCSWLTPAVPEPKKPFTEKIVDAVKGK